MCQASRGRDSNIKYDAVLVNNACTYIAPCCDITSNRSVICQYVVVVSSMRFDLVVFTV